MKVQATLFLFLLFCYIVNTVVLQNTVLQGHEPRLPAPKYRRTLFFNIAFFGRCFCPLFYDSFWNQILDGACLEVALQNIEFVQANICFFLLFVRAFSYVLKIDFFIDSCLHQQNFFLQWWHVADLEEEVDEHLVLNLGPTAQEAGVKCFIFWCLSLFKEAFHRKCRQIILNYNWVFVVLKQRYYRCEEGLSNIGDFSWLHAETQSSHRGSVWHQWICVFTLGLFKFFWQ